MIVRKEYEFPLPEVDGIKAVETKYLELVSKKRDGHLDEYEEDYLDYANNVLMAVE